MLHLRYWFIILSLSLFSLLCSAAAAAPEDPQPDRTAVGGFLRTIAHELHDPGDRQGFERLIALFSESGTVLTEPDQPWVLLSFDRAGELKAVAIHAARLLAAPPLIQRAVLLHELAHLQSARDTRRALRALSVQESPRGAAGGSLPSRGADRLQAIVQVLVEDETRAYRRDLLYVYRAVQVHGGLPAYLRTLPPAQRQPMRRYYQGSVEPFVNPGSGINEARLRRDGIFFGTLPRHHRRYYEAALAWEALQGHVQIRRGPDGLLRPTRLLTPAAFLAWLAP